MIDVTDDEVSIVKKRKLSKRQRMMIKQLEKLHPESQKEYISSLLGLSKGPIIGFRENFPMDRKMDILSSKPVGAVLKTLLAQCDSRHGHTPEEKNIGFWIGVEIECFIKPQTEEIYDEDEEGRIIEASIEQVPEFSESAKNRLRTALIKHKVKRTHIKGDGSLRCQNGGLPVEITLLINSTYGFSQLEKLEAALKELECYSNETCGVHIHLDARHLDHRQVETVGQRFERSLHVLKYMIEEKRRGNQYCKMVVSPIKGDRYSAINLTSYEKFKTIEIRMHHGSVECINLIKWIKILQLISKTTFQKSCVTFQDLIEETNMPDELVQYAEEKIKAHSPTFLEQVV